MMKTTLFFGSLLLCMYSLTAHSAKITVYKWQDDRGVTHYSATPPDNYAYQRVVIKTPPERANKPDMGPKLLTQSNAKCERAKANLDVLLTHETITYEDENGEKIILSGDEKRDLLKKQESIIASHCAQEY